MKNLLFSLIATIVFSNLSLGQQDSDSSFNNFFKSNSFKTLSKNFDFEIDNVNFKNYAKILHDSKEYSIYRVEIMIKSKINFITFFSNDEGINYYAVFEKNELEKGLFNHYDEEKNLYASFNVNLEKDQMYNFKLITIYSPTLNKSACIAKIYNRLKTACETDMTCDFLCDLNPSCTPMLLAWAASYCLIH